MRISNFLDIPKDRYLAETAYFFLIYDGFPVSPGHILIISKRLRQDYFDLDENERNDLSLAILVAKDILDPEYRPDAYNIGMNCGEHAGQTVFHFHCHVIPRYSGDMKNPRGGVRHVIPEKGNY